MRTYNSEFLKKNCDHHMKIQRQTCGRHWEVNIRSTGEIIRQVT